MGDECITYVGEAYWGFGGGDLRKGDHLAEPGIDGRVILGCIFWKGCSGMDWFELAGACECGNESLDSIKCGKFLD